MKLERYGLSTLVARNGILYPETGDFVAESRLFPDTKLPFSTTSVDRPLAAFEHTGLSLLVTSSSAV